MPIFLRRETTSVESLREELIFTEALLIYDEVARDLAPGFTALVNKSEQVWLEQRKTWREEAIARALASYRDYKLDHLTTRFHQILVRVLEDAGSREPTQEPRYRLYFPEALSRHLSCGLESQLERSRGWPAALRREPEQALKDFAALFEAELAAGGAALLELRSAQMKQKSYRAKEISALFEEANAERRALWGKLSAREVERRLPRGWAEQFFRKSPRAEEDPVELKQKAVLLTFAARGLELSEEGRKKILGEGSPEALDRWLSRAGVAPSQEELFGG
jgi:hypothetical protein